MTTGIKPTRCDYFMITSVAADANYIYAFNEHSKTLTSSTQIAPIPTSEPVPSAAAVIECIQPAFVRVDPNTFTMWIDDGLVDAQPVHLVTTLRVPNNVK